MPKHVAFTSRNVGALSWDIKGKYENEYSIAVEIVCPSDFAEKEYAKLCF